MDQLIKRIATLISVKSFVTLIMTIVFAVLALKQYVDASAFKDIFYVIIAFYFGTQSQKVQDAIDK